MHGPAPGRGDCPPTGNQEIDAMTTKAEKRAPEAPPHRNVEPPKDRSVEKTLSDALEYIVAKRGTRGKTGDAEGSVRGVSPPPDREAKSQPTAANPAKEPSPHPVETGG